MEISARSIWERAAGVASLVATPLVPSHYVELIDPLRTTHVRHARVEAVRDETPDARTLTLRPGTGWRPHRAGQFVKVGVEVDGRILGRTYSITSAPERADGRITITVKALVNGRASVALARHSRPGDYLTIGLPQGDFTLPEGPPPARVLFVTGGSGITPVMSMLRSLAARGAMPDVVHVHYVKTPPDLIFGYELARLASAGQGYRLTVVTTRKGGSRFDRATLDAIAPDWRSRETWACGPEPLLDAVAEHVPSAHVERFRAKLGPAPHGAAGGRVRFGRSKKELDASGATSLLEAAERAGVFAPHGCRMGICHSCDATLLGGCVRDLRNGRTIDEPGASFQPCVCAAAGDVEIDL